MGGDAESGPAAPARSVELILGPLLRYAGTESATFWVETSEACEVEILGHRTSTFTVESHHYALLLVETLTPASVIDYTVRLDGRLVWPPEDGRPHSAVHTRNEERHVRLVFGSCRVGDPEPTGDRATPDRDRRALDVLASVAARRGGLARCAPPPRRPGLRRRSLTRDRNVHPRSTGCERGARRGDRRLRGIHPSVSRGVVRSGHPVAAFHRAERDGLRRSRRQRRLEHLLAVGRRDARPPLVGRTNHRGFHVVLGLPTHREPLAARARRRRDVRRSFAKIGMEASAYARSRAAGTASRPRHAGRSTATSASHGYSSSTHAPRACSATGAAR